MTSDEAKIAADEINSLLAAGQTQKAADAAGALREQLRADVATLPELAPNLQKVESALAQLEAAGVRPRAAAAPTNGPATWPPPGLQRTSTAKPTAPKGTFDTVEGLLQSVSGIYGVLSFIGGLWFLYVAVNDIDPRMTSIRIGVASLALNAMLLGLFAGCMGHLVATISARQRYFGERTEDDRVR